MRVAASRIALLSAALGLSGVALGAEPLVWLAAALAIVGLAAFAAALRGVK